MGYHQGTVDRTNEAPAMLTVSFPRLYQATSAIADEDRLKDQVSSRILTWFEKDERTGCLVFVGDPRSDTPPWQQGTGYGLLRVAGKQCLAHRVCAWLWVGGFNLHDPRVDVFHLCPTPACCWCGDVADSDDPEADDPNGPLIGGHLLVFRHNVLLNEPRPVAQRVRAA